MWWWILGITVGLLIAAGVTLAVLARGYSARTLRDSWPLIDTQPAAVLPRLTLVARKWQRQYDHAKQQQQSPPATLVSNLQQARVGEALCHLKLLRADEAIAAETISRGLGPLRPELVTRLCSAWLTANPVSWAEMARLDLVEYLALPEVSQQVELKQRVTEMVLRLLELPTNATPEQMNDVIAFGTRVVTGAPGLNEAHYRLGLALQRAGRLDEACISLTKAAEAAPQDPQRQLAWARAQWDAGRKVAARRTYLVAYRLQRDPDTVYAVGQACFQTSDIQFEPADGPELAGRQPLACAARFFDEVTTKRPEWTDAWLSRAEAELQLGEYTAAEASAKRAAELDRDCIQAQAILGRCRLHSGNVTDAKHSLELLQ